MVALVTSAAERIPLLESVPTFREAGYPDIGGSIWFWLAGPKNLPAPIVDRLSREVRRILRTAELRRQFERDALLAKDLDPPALTAFIDAELKRWSSFVEEAGLRQK